MSINYMCIYMYTIYRTSGAVHSNSLAKLDFLGTNNTSIYNILCIPYYTIMQCITVCTCVHCTGTVYTVSILCVDIQWD